MPERFRSAEFDAVLATVSAGIAEALVTTAVGLFVAVPAVWMYNYFSSKIEGFDVEMDNSSSELIDYFIKRSSCRTQVAGLLMGRSPGG
jgi:biopolymer transport protein ExbB/biopolymer transport protein TolQ